jgi:hypothetical protein
VLAIERENRKRHLDCSDTPRARGDFGGKYMGDYFSLERLTLKEQPYNKAAEIAESARY